MDANIKTMYTVMAKTEELSNKMKSTEALAARMLVQFEQNDFVVEFSNEYFFACRRDIRKLVDVLDSVA